MLYLCEQELLLRGHEKGKDSMEESTQNYCIVLLKLTVCLRVDFIPKRNQNIFQGSPVQFRKVQYKFLITWFLMKLELKLITLHLCPYKLMRLIVASPIREPGL